MKDFPFFRSLFLVLLESLSSCLNEFPFNLLLELLNRWSLLKNSGYHCNCELICFCFRRLGPSIQETHCLLKVAFHTNNEFAHSFSIILPLNGKACLKQNSTFCIGLFLATCQKKKKNCQRQCEIFTVLKFFKFSRGVLEAYVGSDTMLENFRELKHM